MKLQGIKSLLSLKSKHCISKQIYQGMILQPHGTVCHANIEDPCLKVILLQLLRPPREGNQKIGSGAASSPVKAGQAQSLSLLCAGLNLANHTCEFWSLSSAPGNPFMEGLAAVPVIMVICALAPGFRQLSKPAPPCAPPALPCGNEAATRTGWMGVWGGEAGRVRSSLHSAEMGGEATHVHWGRYSYCQCVSPVSGWTALPS